MLIQCSWDSSWAQMHTAAQQHTALPTTHSAQLPLTSLSHTSRLILPLDWSALKFKALAKCHVLSSPSLGRVFQSQSPRRQQQNSVFLNVRLNIAGGGSNCTEGKQTGCCGNYSCYHCEQPGAVGPGRRHSTHRSFLGSSFHPLPVKIYLG